MLFKEKSERNVGPPPRTLPVTEEDTPPTTPASYRVPPRARHLPTAFVRSGPQEDRVPKRGSYHSTTATSVRGSHGQTTRRAPPEAADGRKTRRGGRSRQGTPRAELDGLSQGRLPSVRSHRRLYGGQPAHIRSWQSRMDPCGEDGRWGAVVQGGVAGSGKVHGLLAQGRRGGQPTTCDQTGLSWSWAPHTFVGRCREWPGRCKPGGEYTPA